MKGKNKNSGQPLFSFCIAAYNNYKYIKEAVNSVFEQDYPNIEIIISNDGSKDFDEVELSTYIEKNKGANISRVVINNNEKNIGTVKNVNYLCDTASGEYIMLMAADDTLFDSTVISRFVHSFENEHKDKYCISAKTAMCTEDINEIISMEPQQAGINAIKELSSEQLFSKLSHTFIIPTTSTCYRKELFEELGGHDEDCYIIEDAPLYLKMARKGYKFGWIDDFVAARHRDGGISHGNTRNKSETYRRYRFDEIVIFTKEILPYRTLIEKDDLLLTEAKWKYIEGAYYNEFLLLEDGTIDYREYDRIIIEPILGEMQKMATEGSIRSQMKNSAENISIGENLRKIIKMLLCALLLGMVERIVYVFDAHVFQCEQITFLICILMYGALFGLVIRHLYSVAIRVLWKLYRLFKRG